MLWELWKSTVPFSLVVMMVLMMGCDGIREDGAGDDLKIITDAASQLHKASLESRFIDLGSGSVHAVAVMGDLAVVLRYRPKDQTLSVMSCLQFREDIDVGKSSARCVPSYIMSKDDGLMFFTVKTHTFSDFIENRSLYWILKDFQEHYSDSSLKSLSLSHSLSMMMLSLSMFSDVMGLPSIDVSEYFELVGLPDHQVYGGGLKVYYLNDQADSRNYFKYFLLVMYNYLTAKKFIKQMYPKYTCMPFSVKNQPKDFIRQKSLSYGCYGLLLYN
ncbi:MAG: hypothetical protein OXC44_06465 [Proteobacteria bacterium]|nr:hypothetical protein [Pseudomonadota bacterium]